MSRPVVLALAVLATVLVSTAEARRLSCAAVRAALARGASPPEVAAAFRTSTRRVVECKRREHHRRSGIEAGRRQTATPIPQRATSPTLEPVEAPAPRPRLD